MAPVSKGFGDAMNSRLNVAMYSAILSICKRFISAGPNLRRPEKNDKVSGSDRTWLIGVRRVCFHLRRIPCVTRGTTHHLRWHLGVSNPIMTLLEFFSHFTFFSQKGFLLCMRIFYSTELEELGVLSSRVICFPFDRLEKTEWMMIMSWK